MIVAYIHVHYTIIRNGNTKFEPYSIIEIKTNSAPWSHRNNSFKDLDSVSLCLPLGLHGLSIVVQYVWFWYGCPNNERTTGPSESRHVPLVLCLCTIVTIPSFQVSQRIYTCLSCDTPHLGEIGWEEITKRETYPS